jgi:diguanylate cyclase (GGDEF)-like protein/PAS domain S-box-containing protein
MEEELLREKERAEITLHSIGDAVITTDGDGVVDYLNPVAEALTGWSLAEAHGIALTMVFPMIDEQYRRPAIDLVSRCLALEPPATLSEHGLLLNRSDREYAVKISVTALKDRLGSVLTFQDVTSERRSAREISYNATHDALTGLINRREFEQRLQRVLHDMREQPSLHVLCYMDLDRFKLVNDTCGHLAGDELLRQISGLLQSNSRKRDTLARLGGDEFALLMEHCPLDQAQRVAEKLRAALEAFRFSWDSHGFAIGISIGLVEISATSGNLPELLKQADTACYIAKDSGRNRIHIYRPEAGGHARQNGAIRETASIRQALTQRPLQLYAQIIADIGSHDRTRTAAGVSYEVLARLPLASGQQLKPGTFIPVAERYNLSAELDCRVIEQTCRQLTARAEHLPRLALCTINLCAQSLQDGKVFALLREILQRYAIPPARICFEIKETTAINHLSSATRFIDQVKTLGCSFALDNFGSGLTSFSYLKNLPVDFLKIDGRFVKRITDDPIDLAMVMAINQIGHVMAKKIIAEHVESEAVLHRLQSFGVDYAQGFYLGHPVPLEEMTQISYSD